MEQLSSLVQRRAPNRLSLLRKLANSTLVAILCSIMEFCIILAFKRKYISPHKETVQLLKFFSLGCLRQLKWYICHQKKYWSGDGFCQRCLLHHKTCCSYAFANAFSCYGLTKISKFNPVKESNRWFL